MMRAIKQRSPFLSIRLPKTHIFCNLVANYKTSFKRNVRTYTLYFIP